MAESLKILEKELLRERDRYNTLFALAKRSRPQLKEERFTHNLAGFLAPLVAKFPEEKRATAIKALYPLCLELTGQELFERSEAVSTLWRELLTTLPSLHTVAAPLTNAVYNLEQEPGADWRFWLKQMGKAVPLCTHLQSYLRTGQVLSWVSGLAHYRESALQLARELPEALLDQLVPRWDRVRTDPWWPRRPRPGELSLVHQVGSFVGYGGVFRKPPEVVCAGPNRFLVSHGNDDWLLSCDGFGATLKRVCELELEDVPRENFELGNEGTILWRGKTHAFPVITPVKSFDTSGPVLAVTSHLSHRVFIFLGDDS